MKEIECPACGEMIPDDSKYCDMCGVELLECVNCGTLGTDMFCPECGKPMVSRKTVNTSKKSKNDKSDKQIKQKEPVEKCINIHPADDFKDDGTTTVGRQRKKNIVLKARKGDYIIQPEHEAIIGRKEGPYKDMLKGCDLMSRRHGKFVKRGRDWYIVDFGSTNGTLVNDVELAPDTPVKFTAGDVIDIGMSIFDVIEQ